MNKKIVIVIIIMILVIIFLYSKYEHNTNINQESLNNININPESLNNININHESLNNINMEQLKNEIKTDLINDLSNQIKTISSNNNKYKLSINDDGYIQLDDTTSTNGKWNNTLWTSKNGLLLNDGTYGYDLINNKVNYYGIFSGSTKGDYEGNFKGRFDGVHTGKFSGEYLGIADLKGNFDGKFKGQLRGHVLSDDEEFSMQPSNTDSSECSGRIRLWKNEEWGNYRCL